MKSPEKLRSIITNKRGKKGRMGRGPLILLFFVII
jgi:hypothetical protein